MQTTSRAAQLQLFAYAYYACALLSLLFCVSRVNASGHIGDMTLSNAMACADVSAAVMARKTAGVVHDCAMAKSSKLCARDPATAERLCPVACAIGCGDPDSFAPKMVQHLKVPLAACADVFARLAQVDVACASSNSSRCALRCAAELVRLMQNSSCMAHADQLLDIDGPDKKDDSNASTLRNYARFCKNHQSQSVLTAEISALLGRGCAVDTSKVLSQPAARTTGPGGCQDDDAVVQKVSGMTCEHVAQRKACTFFGKSCQCSCPAA